MKKLLPVFLIATLLLAACQKSTGTEPGETATATEEITKEETAKEETTEESKEVSDGIDVSYNGDGNLPIVEIDGKKYFDYTSEQFLKKLNEKGLEAAAEVPTIYKLSDQPGDQGQVVLESDGGILCLLEIDTDSKKIAEVIVKAPQSDDFKMSELAVQAVPVLMTIDPGIEVKYGVMHLADIALAAQISFGSSQYAYEGVHEGIQERIYSEEEFIIFSFTPVDEAVEQAGVETEAAGSTAEKPNFGALSEDIYSFQIQIDEDVYQFPMTYEQFTAYGWVIKGDDTTPYSPSTLYGFEVFNMGDLQCYAKIINFDVNTVPMNQCYVYGMDIDTDMVKKTEATVTLPGGVTLGGSYDDANAIYGTPTRDYDGDNRRTMTYQMDSYQEVEIGSKFDDKAVIGKISIENAVKPEDFVSGEISDEVPEVIAKYQAPTQLSDNFADFIVEYGGDLYQLPAPVSEFVANGWSIVESKSEPTLTGKSGGWVTMMKDNQELKVIAYNYSENATSIINGFVRSVKGGGYSNKTSITITKDITVGMPQTDLEGILTGVTYETDDSGNYIYYSIEPTDSRINSYDITVSKETGAVYQIEVKYEPKYADYVNR